MPFGYLCPLGAIEREVSELSSDEVEAANDHCGYLQSWYFDMADSLCARLTRCYGTIAYQIFDGVTSAMDMGVCIGGDFYERELKYLVEQEWACTVEDVLWRRTKLGLRFDQAQQDLVASLMASIINSESEKRVVNQGY